MGFSFRITEDEYVRSAVSHVEGHRSSKVGLCIYLMLAALCLHLIIMLTYGQMHSPDRMRPGFAFVLYIPLLCLITVPALWRIYWVPRRYSRIYRMDPVLQSEMRVTVTSRGYTRDSDFGEPLRTSWSNYRYWREFKNVILLVEAANDWEITSLNTSNLLDWQREELRDTLSAALSHKK
jgi:hypothetical protein